MMEIKDLRQPAASCRRKFHNTTTGGGAMNVLKKFVAIATLLLVVLSLLPLGIFSVKAQGAVGVYEHGNRNTGANGEKYVALTFDLCQQALDDNVWLDTSIVQVLQSTSTPATFFASGLFVQQHTADITSLANLGFEIEGHSWDHPNNMSEMFDLGTLDLNAHVGATNSLIQQATGKMPTYIRLPAGNGLGYDTRGIPNGVTNKSFLAAINQTGTSVLDWDVVSGDPDAPSAQYVIDNVTRSVQSGSIIVFHGNGRGVHTAEALQTLIPWLKSQGYTLVTVEQMRSLVGLESALETQQPAEATAVSLPSVTPTMAPAKVLASGEYHISLNVGGSYPNYKYPDYAQNMRMYFAYVTAERNLENLPPDLDHFSGSYDIEFDPIWINGIFGPYCSPQGMVDAEVGKTKMGGGACNTSSMVADVLAKVPGVLVDSFSDHYWAPIPEVAPKYQLQVGTGCGSATPQAQSGNDVRIVGAKGLTLHWTIDGDIIKLWVTRTGEGPSWFPQSSDIKVYSDPRDATTSQPQVDWNAYLKRVADVDLEQIDPVVKVLVVIIIVCLFLMLFLIAKNRQLKMRVDQKPQEPFYRIRGWAYLEMVILAVVYLVTKSEVVKILLGLTVQLSVFLWVSKVVAGVMEFFSVNTQAIVPRLIRDMTCLVFVLVIWSQTAGVLLSTILYLMNVNGAQAQFQEWVPEWRRPEVTVVDPVRYSGPPVVNVPDGMVIPAVWDPILQAVTEEGGTPVEALKLYYIQRSECAKVTDSEFKKCVSRVGAQGPFQFMPTTWPSYSETGWSVWDLHDAARAAYRMTKKLEILDQTTMVGFRNRFCGLDGGLVWNGGSLGSAEYDGCDQAKDIWENYEAAMAKGFGETIVTLPEMPALPIFPDQSNTILCQDLLEPCGFALPGGPGAYVKGTSAIGGKGFHENAWDYWDAAKMSSSENPIDVLSMLNGTVAEVGRFSNGGNGGGTTYMIITNERGWKQTIYHCDTDYVAQGMTVSWGQAVCLMGNQGQSDWTHLHLGMTDPSGQPVLDLEQWWPK